MEGVSPKIYKLFFDETRGHVQYAEEHLKGGLAIIDTQTRQDLGRRFHTVRGGAGFLQLEKLAAIASDLDTLFLKSNREGQELITMAVDLLSSFKNQLEEECRNRDEYK